jgi:hypothetical protein
MPQESPPQPVKLSYAAARPRKEGYLALEGGWRVSNGDVFDRQINGTIRLDALDPRVNSATPPDPQSIAAAIHGIESYLQQAIALATAPDCRARTHRLLDKMFIARRRTCAQIFRQPREFFF